MSWFAEYMFERIEERDGRVLPFTRLDVLLSVVAAFALMAALAYGVEQAWSAKRATVVLFVLLASCLAAKNRGAVVGCAAGIVALRALVGALFMSPHTAAHWLQLLAVFVVGTVVAWLLLKRLH